MRFGTRLAITVGPSRGEAETDRIGDVDAKRRDDDDAANAVELLNLLEKRAYNTYLTRLKASERLAKRNHAWNTSLISTSAATTVASVGLLADKTLYGPAGEALLVCLSILTVIASLITSGLDYSGRSRNMFLNYRRVQQLSARAERAAKQADAQNMRTVEELNAKYDALLDESENGTEADYFRAFPDKKPKWSWSLQVERSLTLLPYASLLVPLVIMVPLLLWLLP